MTPTCVEPDCARPVVVKARGLCKPHYNARRLAGTLEPLDLFSKKVQPGDGCWEWLGGHDKGGYGKWASTVAHRVAWERVHGPIPGDLTVDHLCKNPGCVNVAHLRLLSLSENCSDNKWRDRTHCINGHAWDATNTGTRKRNGKTTRVCRACDRDHHVKAREARRAVA